MFIVQHLYLQRGMTNKDIFIQNIYFCILFSLDLTNRKTVHFKWFAMFAGTPCGLGEHYKTQRDLWGGAVLWPINMAVEGRTTQQNCLWGCLDLKTGEGNQSCHQTGKSDHRKLVVFWDFDGNFSRKTLNNDYAVMSYRVYFCFSRPQIVKFCSIIL